MCGIAGYIGPRNGVEVVYDQLKRLEYRGYDSAGIAYPKDGHIEIVKRAGSSLSFRSFLTKPLETQESRSLTPDGLPTGGQPTKMLTLTLTS